MPTPRPVVTYQTNRSRAPAGHDVVGRRAVAERLAATLGTTYRGDYDGREAYDAPPYFVPDDALERPRAHRLGITTPDDLYGGVVPQAFVATKAITHGLVRPGAAAPEGWSPDMAPRVEGAVLRGYTAFTRDDALAAVRELLDGCGVRLKRCDGIGGGGQDVVHDLDAATRVLDAIEPEALEATGIVVEENLAGVTTFSVGLVLAGPLTLCYCGTQRTVRNGQGHEVYGGSTLDCVRGGFDALAALALPDDVREAVVLARRYDQAALASYPGVYASRRNYDVARGRGRDGSARAGVLEQSWRVGGASGAEVRAIEAFLGQSSLDRVRASTVETYEADPRVPDGAFVYFRGTDAHGTPLTKYATLANDGDA
jgi:hypothetical protein